MIKKILLLHHQFCEEKLSSHPSLQLQSQLQLQLQLQIELDFNKGICNACEYNHIDVVQ